MTEPLIHIGYHKTATTWLQTVVFREAAVGFSRPFKKGQIKESLVFPSALHFDPERCRSELQPGLSAAAEQGLVPVVTAERLSGDPSSGGYDGKELANRVASVFPKSRVLVVIREQRRMILSAYKNYVKLGGSASIRRYLEPPASKFGAPQFDFRHFEYDRLIAHYLDLFGPRRVLVLPYELLPQAPEDFVTRVVEFAGAKPRSKGIRKLRYEERRNEAFSAAVAAIMRRFNALFVGDGARPPALLPSGPRGERLEEWARERGDRLSRLDRAIPGSVKRPLEARLQAAVEQFAGGRYADSNRRTQELAGIDLAAHGYELATSGSGQSPERSRREARALSTSG